MFNNIKTSNCFALKEINLNPVFATCKVPSFHLGRVSDSLMQPCITRTVQVKQIKVKF